MLRQEWASQREKNRQFHRQRAMAEEVLPLVVPCTALVARNPDGALGPWRLQGPVDAGTKERQLQPRWGLAPK